MAIETLARHGQMSYKMSGTSGMTYVMSFIHSYGNVTQ